MTLYYISSLIFEVRRTGSNDLAIVNQAFESEYRLREDYLEGEEAVQFFVAYLAAKGAVLGHMTRGMTLELAISKALQELDHPALDHEFI